MTKKEKSTEQNAKKSSSSEPLTNRTVLNVTTISLQDEIKKEIRSLENDISELNNQLKIYKTRVENTPKREQELMSLKRDYQNIQTAYNSLLNRKLEAEIAVNMEKKQKGEQFHILDLARLPEKPISPNMASLFVISLAAGLGLGCGLIFLQYSLDTSFKRNEDIESFLGIPVVGILPIIYNQKDIQKQKLFRFMSASFITISFILFIGFAVLTFKGVDQTMELIGRIINI